MITPAISVLSALEGLELAAPGFKPWVVPLTCVVLVGLFSIQRRGTGSVGKIFGPIMVIWFLTIGALGLKELAKNPEILGALSPQWGALYFAHHGLRGLAILGVVVLAITGGEALYADMGHFGVRAHPPRVARARLARARPLVPRPGRARPPRSAALANPFFAMVPAGAATYVLVGPRGAGDDIASQSLISGVFSLTHQAVQLGYFPRVTVQPHVARGGGADLRPAHQLGARWWRASALVVGFKESARLASAYGIAVSGTMAMTSIVFFDVTRQDVGVAAVARGAAARRCSFRSTSRSSRRTSQVPGRRVHPRPASAPASSS